MEPVTLTTDRLVLRPFGPDDAGEVHAACQDPDIHRWTAVPSPYGREQAEGWVTEVMPRAWAEDTEYGFAVRPRGGGPLLASVGVHVSGVPGARAYEIGYWATREHRGRGYVSEAVTGVARWLFTDVGAARLQWRAEVGNTASRAAAEKAGFRFEGTLRAALDVRGTRRDAWVGGLLPADLGLPAPVPYLPAVSAGA
ncbi:GNAT family N-acetyltransferase [Streptomyces sp. NPDC012888]|uniref:GNAT family N-acetyltransferase n=1 Tax=Streptomyces sp. NPDC012888 TaxID=3364855 RepID=UPI0036B54724